MQFSKESLDQTFEAHPYEKQLEMVLAVDKAELFYRLPAYAQGMISADISQLLTDLRWHLYWLPRRTAEQSGTLIHFIPYGPIIRQGEGGIAEIATYNRPSKNNGEALLAGKSSIGWAGHPDFLDAIFDARAVVNGVHTCTEAFFREIAEEAEFILNGEIITIASHPELFRISTNGVILDRSDQVGQVHLGLVYVIHVLNSAVEISAKNPAEILNPKFEAFDQVFAEIDDRNFENWSKIIMSDMVKQWNQSLEAENKRQEWEAAKIPALNATDETLSMDEYIDKYRSDTQQVGYVQVLRGGKLVWEHPSLKMLLDNQEQATLTSSVKIDNENVFVIDNLDSDPMSIDRMVEGCLAMFEEHYKPLGIVFDEEGVRRELEEAPASFKKFVFWMGTYETDGKQQVAYGLSFDTKGVSWHQSFDLK